jgi:hypothetical protein
LSNERKEAKLAPVKVSPAPPVLRMEQLVNAKLDVPLEVAENVVPLVAVKDIFWKVILPVPVTV